MISYTYPLLGVFWTMMLFFLFVIWIMILFKVIVDVLRSDDLGGVAKTVWLIFIIMLPFLGLFVYLIARGKKMGQREIDHARAQQQQFDSHVREVASTPSPAAELSKLADLKASGAITDAEFEQQKAKLLA